jgi:hypothetical protein
MPKAQSECLELLSPEQSGDSARPEGIVCGTLKARPLRLFKD